MDRGIPVGRGVVHFLRELATLKSRAKALWGSLLTMAQPHTSGRNFSLISALCFFLCFGQILPFPFMGRGGYTRATAGTPQRVQLICSG